MIKSIYRWLLLRTSRPEDRGGISAGYWQSKVREKALGLLDGAGKILDIGCGEGLFLEDLVRAFPRAEIYGVDLDASQIEKAGKRLGDIGPAKVSLSIADAAKLDFKDGYFDSVVFINLLLGIPADEKVDSLFKEASRLCKAGGAVVFDVRNRKNILIYLKYKLAKYYDDTISGDRLRLFDVEGIEKRLVLAGFRVEKMEPIGFPGGRLAPIIMIKARKGAI